MALPQPRHPRHRTVEDPRHRRVTRSRARPGGRGPRRDRRDVDRAAATLPRHTGERGEQGRTDPDVWLLHVQLERTGDADVLAALVEEYRPYARGIARQQVRHGEPLEDIEQVAMEALVASLQRFDVDRGLPFPAFARPTISGAIKRHYRDRGWSVRTPRSVHDLASPLRDAEERLTAEAGRRPTSEELATALDVPEEAVQRTRQAIRERTATSLDHPVVEGGPTQAESLGGADPDLTSAAERIDLRDALDHLDDHDRTLLQLYYVDELSQREIGGRYGVSQMQVSRWLTSCVRRLRGRVDAAVP